MKNTVDKLLGWVLVILMTAMTLDVLWGVVTRYVAGRQAPWSEELARYLLIWIGLLGSAYAAGQNMHLSIDLLPNKLKPRDQRRLNLFIQGLIALFALTVMVIGGFRLMYVTQVLRQLSPALRIPISWVYAVIPLSGLLTLWYTYYFAKNLTKV